MITKKGFPAINVNLTPAELKTLVLDVPLKEVKLALLYLNFSYYPSAFPNLSVDELRLMKASYDRLNKGYSKWRLHSMLKGTLLVHLYSHMGTFLGFDKKRKNAIETHSVGDMSFSIANPNVSVDSLSLEESLTAWGAFHLPGIIYEHFGIAELIDDLKVPDRLDPQSVQNLSRFGEQIAPHQRNLTKMYEDHEQRGYDIGIINGIICLEEPNDPNPQQDESATPLGTISRMIGPFVKNGGVVIATNMVIGVSNIHNNNNREYGAFNPQGHYVRLNLPDIEKYCAVQLKTCKQSLLDVLVAKKGL